MQRIANLEDELIAVTHNTLVDFMFSFEEINNTFHQTSIDMISVEDIITHFSKGGDGSVSLQQIDEILKIISYNIKCEIPIRPTGFDIKSYEALEGVWNKYRDIATIQ